MKRLLQLIGIRKWSGEDLVSLQAEPLKTIDAFFATYGNSIFNGCEVTPAADNVYNITPGFVALQGKDQDNQDTFKVAPFPGLENVALPVYLTLSYNVIEKEYVDGKVKPAAYDYHATASSIRPEDGTPYLEITATGGRRFIDAVGITQKLDKTGNGKDVTVTFAQATDRTNVQTGDKLAAILGKIARWFADLKAVAFSGKAADLTDDAAHRFVTDIEKAGWGDKYTRTETDNKDAAALAAAKTYTDTLGGNVYKKTETYTKAETDNNIAALGNDVYRKAEVYTKNETDNKDTATLEAAKQYAVARLAEIIGGSPAALDTLYEIAAALNNDPNFATTIMALVNGKAPLVHTHTPEQCGAAPVNHSHAGVYQPAGNYAAADHGHTGYATTTHKHDGTYAAAAHNHNINQITGFPASMPASDVYPWAKSATKPAYNAAEVGAAPSNHNHDTTYQPKGNYSTVGHGHTAGDITEQTNKRFLTDVERTKIGFLANIEDAGDVLRVICAGFIDGAGKIRGFWGKKRVGNQVFTVSYSSTGVYTITHNFGGSGYGVIANARHADGLLFVGVVSRVDNSFTMAATDTGNYRDAEIYFIVYKM